MTAHDWLMEQLESGQARFRVIDHPPEGHTERASRLREHALAQAAKCLVVRVATGRRSRRYVLAVVPGDRRVDLEGLCGMYGGSEAAFAARDVAERLAGSVSGSVMPFARHPDLELVVDPDLLVHDEIFFNAARLDRSVALDTADYLALARPRVEPIAQHSPPRRTAGRAATARRKTG
ncbi:YbaK/EbsC family protein [Streptomyces sp. NPDC093260]|uniref:YbaK/EbsC family protein n=1 Tax=Streptomyces sp. NPDC093260 TaxID=3155073 RepID=UPI00342A3348